jgi:hypothetical protein
MADQPKLPTIPRSLLRRAENTELSLGSLEAISEIRTYLDELEKLAMISARVKGATVEDIAESLKLTPQAIYYRFRNEKMKFQTAPGQPDLPEPVLAPEAVLTPEVATDPVDDPVPGPDPTLPG